MPRCVYMCVCVFIYYQQKRKKKKQKTNIDSAFGRTPVIGVFVYVDCRRTKCLVTIDKTPSLEGK